MKLYIALSIIFYFICGTLCEVKSNENANLDCVNLCRQWRDTNEKTSTCKCRIEREDDGINATDTSLARTKRDTQKSAPVVGQSNPSASHRQRLINQRVRQRLHQQRAHHTPHRPHHGLARHHITPHHRPHLVGAVRERFGGGEKEGSALKRLRERQKQRGEANKQQQEDGKVKEAETKKGNEKQQQGGNFQIITEPPNLVDRK